MSSAVKKRRKKRSQAPVALVYVVTALISMALLAMLSIYLLKNFRIIGVQKEEEAVVTVQSFNDMFARVNTNGVLADVTLIRMDPVDQTILIVPMSPQSIDPKNNTTFRDIYSTGGMAGVKDAVEETLGLTVDNYASLSNDSFERIFDIYGGITYKANEELYKLSEDNDENDISIAKGELVTLGGRQILQLTQQLVFSSGRQGNTEFLGIAVESLVNSMFQQAYITQDNIDNIYSILTTNSDTDFNEDDYKLQKSYLKDMLSSGLTPAVKMVPEGTWSQNDETFTFSDEFILSLKERAAEATPEAGGGNAIAPDGSAAVQTDENGQPVAAPAEAPAEAPADGQTETAQPAEQPAETQAETQAETAAPAEDSPVVDIEE